MDRRNRLLWAVISFVMFSAAVAGLLVGAGAFGSAAATTPVLPDPLVNAWEQGGVWALVGVAVLGLFLAWLGWRLLRAELRQGGQVAIQDLKLAARGDGQQRTAGWTVVRGPALAHSIEADLRRIRGVERAHVGLFGSPHQPELRAQLAVSSGDLEDIRTQVARCLERFTATTGTSPRTVDITFRLVQKSTAPRVS
jgi:hypothetical protein